MSCPLCGHEQPNIACPTCAPRTQVLEAEGQNGLVMRLLSDRLQILLRKRKGQEELRSEVPLAAISAVHFERIGPFQWYLLVIPHGQAAPVQKLSLFAVVSHAYAVPVTTQQQAAFARLLQALLEAIPQAQFVLPQTPAEAPTAPAPRVEPVVATPAPARPSRAAAGVLVTLALVAGVLALAQFTGPGRRVVQRAHTAVLGPAPAPPRTQTRPNPPPTPAPAYSMPVVTDYAENSAPRALAEYLLAWQRQDWAAMARCTLADWRVREMDPAAVLQQWNSWRHLQGASFVYAAMPTPGSRQFTCRLIIESTVPTPHQIKTQITILVVKDAGGHWGVHPVAPSTAS